MVFRKFSIIVYLICIVNSLFAYERGCDRECVESLDLDLIDNAPDTARHTLAEKLESDSSIIFFGHPSTVKVLAYRNYLQDKANFDTTITDEDRSRFTEWSNMDLDSTKKIFDGLPADSKESFSKMSNETDYSLIQIQYKISKIYDRKNRAWRKASNTETELARKRFVKRGAFLRLTSPEILYRFSNITFDSRFERIFLADGYSRIIDESALDSLDTFATKEYSFIPDGYTREVYKDMSKVYKKRIMEALKKGEKNSIRNNMNMLDSFIEISNDKVFTRTPVPLACWTKRLLSAYLHDFNDYPDCKYTFPFIDDDEQTTITMLLDSIKVSIDDGSLEKALSPKSSGDRAFWRVLTKVTFANSQDEVNKLVLAAFDSIRKPTQKEFLFRNYYREIVTSRVTAEMYFAGGGVQIPTGDVGNYYNIMPNFNFGLEFFYKDIGGGFSARTTSSGETQKLNEGDYLSTFFIDLYFGYRTFHFPHFENRLFVGPSLAFTDLVNNDSDDNPLKSDFSCGLAAGTIFDIYFTAPSIEKLTKSALRLGLRFEAGINTYSTDIVKGANGVVLFFNLALLVQGYETRLKEYGE